MRDDHDDRPSPPEQRSEDEQEELNRQMIELLNELRVAMPGVQVLFGFLLTVPFQQGFTDVNDFQRATYFVTLIASAVASCLLIAPSAYHRLMFERGEKPRIIATGNRALIAGLAALAIAMNGALLLVTDFLFQTRTVALTLVATVSLFAWLWFGMGLWRRARTSERP